MRLILPLLLAASLAMAADQVPTTASASTPDAKPMSVEPAIGRTQVPGFLALREYLLIDLVDCPLDGQVRRYAEVAAQAAKIRPLPPGVDALAIRVDAGRWAIATVQTVYIRASGITVIDARAGSTPSFAPTPAVPGGAGVLPLPQSIGTTVSAGSARVFAGVRTAQINGFKADDLTSIATIIGAPTAEAVLGILSDLPKN